MYSTHIHLCHIFSVYIRPTACLNQSDNTHSEHIDSMLVICKDTFKHADGAGTAEVALNAHFKNMFKGNILIKTSQIHGNNIIDSAREGFC